MYANNWDSVPLHSLLIIPNLPQSTTSQTPLERHYFFLGQVTTGEFETEEGGCDANLQQNVWILNILH